MNLQHTLQTVAGFQLGIAILNLFLPRILLWKPDLDRMALLPRQVFYVHSWFISLTLVIFAVLTWRFASEMATGTNPVCVWLDGSISFFWLFRTFLQVAYYSSSHWRGNLRRTVIHVACLMIYAGMALVYLLCVFS